MQESAGVSGRLQQPGLMVEPMAGVGRVEGWGGGWQGGAEGAAACITRTYYDDEMSDKTPNTLLEKFLPPIRGVQPREGVGRGEGRGEGEANLIGPADRRGGGEANRIKWPSKPLSCIINCASEAAATQKSMLI